eukprot:CAMPEP_0170234714 /NCGR_PEP_ID=MMETSP0116_2-20130129/17101_1 /TAXON_ID=400756 /ORGANISM="Durinskia baltica, Strain CSIRO CS-38" /LENGTH=481 /DNA_ID=CAMNT_0010485505 /DNA_START=16 /DNA_END=1460 /DNA_ORIENTATION=-
MADSVPFAKAVRYAMYNSKRTLEDEGVVGKRHPSRASKVSCSTFTTQTSLQRDVVLQHAIGVGLERSRGAVGRVVASAAAISAAGGLEGAFLGDVKGGTLRGDVHGVAGRQARGAVVGDALADVAPIAGEAARGIARRDLISRTLCSIDFIVIGLSLRTSEAMPPPPATWATTRATTEQGDPEDDGKGADGAERVVPLLAHLVDPLSEGLLGRVFGTHGRLNVGRDGVHGHKVHAGQVLGASQRAEEPLVEENLHSEPAMQAERPPDGEPPEHEVGADLHLLIVLEIDFGFMARDETQGVAEDLAHRADPGEAADEGLAARRKHALREVDDRGHWEPGLSDVHLLHPKALDGNVVWVVVLAPHPCMDFHGQVLHNTCKVDVAHLDVVEVAFDVFVDRCEPHPDNDHPSSEQQERQPERHRQDEAAPPTTRTAAPLAGAEVSPNNTDETKQHRRRQELQQPRRRPTAPIRATPGPQRRGGAR